MVRVLALVSRQALFLAWRRRSPDELRMLRVLEIPDVDHGQAAIAGLARARIEQPGLLRPPAFVRAVDEGATAARPAVVGRRACNLGDLEDLRGVGIARRDIENLELGLLAG